VIAEAIGAVRLIPGRDRDEVAGGHSAKSDSWTLSRSGSYIDPKFFFTDDLVRIELPATSGLRTWLKSFLTSNWRIGKSGWTTLAI
jgi:hypothetical protein